MSRKGNKFAYDDLDDYLDDDYDDYDDYEEENDDYDDQGEEDIKPIADQPPPVPPSPPPAMTTNFHSPVMPSVSKAFSSLHVARTKLGTTILNLNTDSLIAAFHFCRLRDLR